MKAHLSQRTRDELTPLKSELFRLRATKTLSEINFHLRLKHDIKLNDNQIGAFFKANSVPLPPHGKLQKHIKYILFLANNGTKPEGIVNALLREKDIYCTEEGVRAALRGAGFRFHKGGSIKLKTMTRDQRLRFKQQLTESWSISEMARYWGFNRVTIRTIKRELEQENDNPLQ